MFLPDRYVRGTCPQLRRTRPVRRQLRGLRRNLHAGRPAERRLGRQRNGARAARLRAPVFQARRLRADAARVDGLGPAAGRSHVRSSASGSTRDCATGTSRATSRTSVSRFPARTASTSTSGSTRRSATSASLLQLLPPHGTRFRPLLEARQRRRGVSLHRQGHRLLPHAVLAGGAARRGLPAADVGVRARLPDRQRPEDVEVARHA